MKKMISALTIASLLVGNIALAAGNGDVGSVNSPVSFDAGDSLTKIYNSSAEVGGIDAVIIASDLAKARNVTLPDATPADLKKHKADRIAAAKVVADELKAIEKNKSRECLGAAAQLAQMSRGDQFAAVMRSAGHAAPNFLSMEESMTFEYIRVGVGTMSSLTYEEAEKVCNK